MPVYASRLRVAVHQRPLSAFPFGVTLIHRDRCSDSSRRSTKNLRNRKIGANTFKFIILCISIYNHLNWCLRFKNTLPIRHWPYLILPSGPFLGFGQNTDGVLFPAGLYSDVAVHEGVSRQHYFFTFNFFPQHSKVHGPVQQVSVDPHFRHSFMTFNSNPQSSQYNVWPFFKSWQLVIDNTSEDSILATIIKNHPMKNVDQRLVRSWQTELWMLSSPISIWSIQPTFFMNDQISSPRILCLSLVGSRSWTRPIGLILPFQPSFPLPHSKRNSTPSHSSIRLFGSKTNNANSMIAAIVDIMRINIEDILSAMDVNVFLPLLPMLCASTSRLLGLVRWDLEVSFESYGKGGSRRLLTEIE